MQIPELPRELYKHLEKMSKANKIYFIQKWSDEGAKELTFIIQKYFVKEKHYKSQNGVFVIIGVNGFEFYKTELHYQMLLSRRCLDENDLKSIKSFFDDYDYDYEAFDIVLHKYYFFNSPICVIWFATPAMVAEMKHAKELFFLGEDIPANENSTKMNQNTIELNASHINADYEKVEQSGILGDKISQKNTEQLINVEPLNDKNETTIEYKEVKQSDKNEGKVIRPVHSEAREGSISVKNTGSMIANCDLSSKDETSSDNSKVTHLLLAIDQQELSRMQIMAKLEIPEESRKFYNEHYYKPAEKLGFVEKTLKDKPNSKFQKYRLTELGKEKLATFEKTSKSLH